MKTARLILSLMSIASVCMATEKPLCPQTLPLGSKQKGSTIPLQGPIQLRGGLPRSAARFSEGQGHVVFMGGSITHMGARNKPGWSKRVRTDLQRRFPECKFQFENVGIPSVGTLGHAHRFERDVLGQGTPDLLVIEAAVNDLHIGRTAEEARQGMEGVVRSARALGIEVLMLHFADGPHLSTYAQGEVPLVIAEHEAVAQYYAVPSLNLALHVQRQIAEGGMDWKRDFNANCHVPAFGQNLYAEQIGKLLDAAWADGAERSGQRHPRKPLDPAHWTHGRLLPPTSASALNHTKIINSWKPSDKARTREGFVHVPVLEARGAASSFAVAFEGTGVGLWTISGPDAGRIRWRVDGCAWQEVETFTRHSHHLHLPNPMLLARDLKFGAHQLEVEVLPRPEGQHGGEVLRVVHVLVHGASLNQTQ